MNSNVAQTISEFTRLMKDRKESPWFEIFPHKRAMAGNREMDCAGNRHEGLVSGSENLLDRRNTRGTFLKWRCLQYYVTPAHHNSIPILDGH